MTTTQAQKLIGNKAIWSYGTLNFEVAITDTKQAWGETLYLVEPVSGHGKAWIKNLKIGFSQAGDVFSFQN